MNYMQRFGNKVIERTAAELGIAPSTVHYRLDNPGHVMYLITLRTVEKFQREYLIERAAKAQRRQLGRTYAKLRRRMIRETDDDGESCVDSAEAGADLLS